MATAEQRDILDLQVRMVTTEDEVRKLRMKEKELELVVGAGSWSWRCRGDGLRGWRPRSLPTTPKHHQHPLLKWSEGCWWHPLTTKLMVSGWTLRPLRRGCEGTPA